jgi:hypothetical protein
MPDIKELTFLRLIIAEAFNAIPTRLFESIKELTPEMIARIYANSADIMTVPVLDQQGQIVARAPAQSVWVAVMMDIAKVVKGFVWLEFDVIDQRVFVQACAVDPEYQSTDGAVLKNLIEYIKTLPIPDTMKDNIQFVTKKPKAYEKVGCRRSKKVLMELKRTEGVHHANENDNSDK